MIRMHYSESESKLNFMCRIIKLHTKTHGKKIHSRIPCAEFLPIVLN